MSFLRNLYFFQGQKYTFFGKNILHRQSASLGHSATGHSVVCIWAERSAHCGEGRPKQRTFPATRRGSWLLTLGMWYIDECAA